MHPVISNAQEHARNESSLHPLDISSSNQDFEIR